MCPDCEARRKLARDALYRAKVGEAASHVVKGVSEALGLKEKTGEVELQKHLEKPGQNKPNPAQPVNQRP